MAEYLILCVCGFFFFFTCVHVRVHLNMLNIRFLFLPDRVRTPLIYIIFAMTQNKYANTKISDNGANNNVSDNDDADNNISDDDADNNVSDNDADKKSCWSTPFPPQISTLTS